jgi:YD repeat-containing protein
LKLIANFAYPYCRNSHFRHAFKRSRLHTALNRLTAATLSKSGQANQAYTWTYDQTGGMFSHGIGRLTSITFPEGSTSYAYDAQGRVIQARQILSPNAVANPSAVVHYTAYAYDGAGNPTSLTYPSGRVLNISYANGLPTTLTLAGSHLITNIQYPPDSALGVALSGSIGSPKSWSWAMNSGPVSHSRSFDLNGRLTRYPLGEHLRDVTYDAANRITGYQHYIAATGSTAPVQDQQFAYDNASRLTQATTSQATWAYTYDANGNRTSVAVNNGTPNTYTVDPASNRLMELATPAITLTHDAMGNIVSDGTYTMGYDLRGRLTTAAQGGNTTTYAYDNAGQRVRKAKNAGTGDTVIFVYDLSGQMLGEYDSTGQAIREYVWLGNMPVAMFMPDPAQGANAKRLRRWSITSMRIT